MRDVDTRITAATVPDGGRPGAASRLWTALPWASLLPLLLLLHPYGGLVQDARIYIGRGVADLDPAHLGQDMMFAHDEQTGFSLMHAIVRASLSLLSPAAAAMALALLGALLWLVAAVALLRSLVPGRAGWAAAVCVLVLPSFYGAYLVFNYVEAIATPRIFAEAAVLGGLSALSTGRRPLGAALLALAVAFHPLIALPGLGIAAVLLACDDRRWLLAFAAAAALTIGVAVAGVPVADRLFRSIDAVWLSILRERSVYLFPSLWPAEAFGPIACQATAVVVAASLSSPRVRALLLATLGVAAVGVATSWALGDLYPSVLITQVQPWRALWPLAVLGNASVALASVSLWGRGRAGRLTLALLALTWLSSDNLATALAFGAATLGVLAADLRGILPAMSRTVVVSAGALATLLALVGVGEAGFGLLLLLRSARAEGGEVVWPQVLLPAVQTVPLVAGAVALALLAPRAWPRVARTGALAVTLALLAAATCLWDGRTAERRFVERDGDDPALSKALGAAPGEVLWIDEDSETWFLARRPAFLNSIQAGPILFSRDLAVEWAGRAKRLLALGLARPEDLAPWSLSRHASHDLALSRVAVTSFCADPLRPAALVAPGEQLAAAPPGWPARLWRPPVPIRRIASGDDSVHWREMAVFTVIRCPGSEAVAPRAVPAASVTPVKTG